VIALDTNVLARWILRDDEAQYAVADRILSGECWLGWTVVLELAWLLGSYGGLKRREVADVLDTLLAMRQMHFDNAERLQWAVDRFRAGGDIADLIHIASTGAVESFVTFEKKLAGKAGAGAPVPVRRAV